jgi:hypothetical protein
MRFWTQVFFFFMLAVIQVSWAGTAFPEHTIQVVFAGVFAVTLLRGFFDAWPWAVFLGCVFDALAGYPIGATAIVSVAFAYAVSFVSRRFLLEYREIGLAFSIAVFATTATVFVPIERAVRGFATASFRIPSLESLLSDMALSSVWRNAIVFWAVYESLRTLSRLYRFSNEKVIVRR